MRITRYLPAFASALVAIPLFLLACGSSRPPEAPVEKVIDVKIADVPDAGMSVASQEDVWQPKEWTYRTNAKDAFDDAEDAFNHHDFTSATRLYTVLKAHYPYSRFARDAELRLADVKVECGEFADAATAYDEWIRVHPADPRVSEVRTKADAARRNSHP